MKKVTVIKATEQEIIDLINDHFILDIDSISELQELDNQDWFVQVDPYDNDPSEFIKGTTLDGFSVPDALDKLCFDGVLEAGEYIIDCTW